MWTQSCRVEDLVAGLKANFYYVMLKTKFKNPTYSKTLLHATTTSTSGSIPRKKMCEWNQESCIKCCVNCRLQFLKFCADLRAKTKLFSTIFRTTKTAVRTSIQWQVEAEGEEMCSVCAVSLKCRVCLYFFFELPDCSSRKWFNSQMSLSWHQALICFVVLCSCLESYLFKGFTAGIFNRKLWLLWVCVYVWVCCCRYKLLLMKPC